MVRIITGETRSATPFFTFFEKSTTFCVFVYFLQQAFVGITLQHELNKLLQVLIHLPKSKHSHNKKAPKGLFAMIQKRINASRTVDAYVLCASRPSYAQPYVHHGSTDQLDAR